MMYRFALFLVLPAILAAQSQSPASLPQLVRARVLVTDARGEPVTDLAARDFHVTDQAKNQDVVFLHPPMRVHAPATAGPGEVHNRATLAAPHTTVILLDLLNQLQVNRLESFRKIEKALPSLSSSEHVYLYQLNIDGALEPLVPMKNGKGAILEPPKDWHKDASRLLEKTASGLARPRPAGLLQEDVVKKTYVALETLANQLVAFPGARDILWVTDGVPSVSNPRTPCSGDWLECALYVPHLSVTLDRAGAAVHTLSYGSGLPSPVTLAMEDLTGSTGGRTFFAEEIHAVLDQLSAAAASSYFLAFAPPPNQWDNKFHKLRITCDRKGGKVYARQRYYAFPDQAQVPAIEFAAMTAQLKLPADAPEISLRGKAAPSSKPGARFVQIRIDPADLLTVPQDGAVAGQVSVIYAQYGPKDLLGATPVSTFNLRLSPQQRDAAVKDGLAFDQDILIDPRARTLRFLIYDRGARFLGSLTLPLSSGSK